MTNCKGAAGHLSDDVLIRLLSNELPEGEAQGPKDHLATCWACRARYEELEEVALGIAAYSKEEAAPDSGPMPEEDPLLERLRLAARAAIVPRWWTRVLPSFPVKMNPALATATVFLVAVIALVFWQRNLRTVTASELISRAVAADAKRSNPARSGVAYQNLRVRTRTGTFEHAVYRDVEGRRRPRAADTDEMRPYQAELALAGVGWDEPLAAITFKTWHDEQKDATDEVKASGDGLLTLTTRVPHGVVREESLTVRADSFRPVERSVEFADIGVIDFLELSYDVLPWSVVNSELFEPVPGPPAATHPTVHAAPASAPILPLTTAQLDEAEVLARLVLNKLDAESSERLQIERKATGVQITGIVATNERKTELQAGLETLPHVSTSISTFDEAQSRSGAGSGITSVRSASVVEKPTPLAAYLMVHGRSPADSAALSRRLLNAAVSVYQETKALADLTSRFAGGANLTENGAVALDELHSRHKMALLAALDEEEKVLAETGSGISTKLPPSNTPNDPVESVSAAERNLRLCKELSSGTGNATGTVEQDVPEITDLAVRLRAFAQTAATVHGSAGRSEKS